MGALPVPVQALNPVLDANREDLALWGVYGDALEAAGNPHGALVAMMCEREQRPSVELLRHLR